MHMPRRAFPDLKGQAPLRQLLGLVLVADAPLFLTSKVRLHCDPGEGAARQGLCPAFPDLKGQAPLRRDR